MWLLSEQIANLENLCSDVLKTNAELGFAAIINSNGRIEACKGNCILTALSNVRQEMFYMTYMLKHKMRQDFNGEFGKVRFTYTERDNTGFLSFPLDDLLLVISCNSKTLPKPIAIRIMSLIKKYINHSVLIQG